MNFIRNFKVASVVMTFALLLLVGISGGVWGQVATTYSFVQTTGTYADITGGTLLGTATANAMGTTSLDDNVYPVTGLPFTFTYNGVGYTSFNINSNGYITFGATAPAGTVYIPLSSTTAYAGAVSAWGRDLNALFSVGGLTGTLRWETVGTAPNREVVIQWKNFRLAYSISTTIAPYLDFQIRLKETSNVIDVIYGPSGMAAGTSTAATAYTAQVGLRGPNNTFATNVLNRTNTTGSINSSTDGTTNSSTQSTTLGSFSSNGTPGRHTNGKIYRYTPIVVAACSGTPNTGTATITSSTGCPSANFTLNSSGLSTGTGISYLWESSPNNSTWTSTGTSTASYSTSTATTMYYQLKTTCSGSGLSNTTNAVSYTVASNFCACSTYPACTATSAADDEILNVTVGTLNNTSTCASLAGGSGSVVAMYSNYSGIIAAPSLMQTSSISGSVTIGFCSGTAYTTGFAVYIDYNQNGVFTDVGEMVYSPNAVFTPAVAGTAYPFAFTVPAGATLGITRMRIVNTESVALPGSTGTYSWGETEDYCVTIIAKWHFFRYSISYHNWNFVKLSMAILNYLWRYVYKYYRSYKFNLYTSKCNNRDALL